MTRTHRTTKKTHTQKRTTRRPRKDITQEQLTTILLEVTNSDRPSLRTPEATQPRKQLANEVKAIAAKGGIVDIPSDW